MTERRTLFERMCDLATAAPRPNVDAMTKDERRRYDAGRTDWREEEWQDHCGDPHCERCPPGPPSTQL